MMDILNKDPYAMNENLLVSKNQVENLQLKSEINMLLNKIKILEENKTEELIELQSIQN